jgi:hypothetical protein
VSVGVGVIVGVAVSVAVAVAVDVGVCVPVRVGVALRVGVFVDVAVRVVVGVAVSVWVGLFVGDSVGEWLGVGVSVMHDPLPPSQMALSTRTQLPQPPTSGSGPHVEPQSQQFICAAAGEPVPSRMARPTMIVRGAKAAWSFRGRSPAPARGRW